jgi:alkylation response protein AidB-like acyl-CoA dehydrogenase
MDFGLSDSAERFAHEVRTLLATELTDEVRTRVHASGTTHDWGLHRAIARRGWIERALPEHLGGQGHDPSAFAVLIRELELAGAPADGVGVAAMMASVLAHVGNHHQRAEIVPKLLHGDTIVALGYTEPNSGSDVAAARTRAVRDGSGWRIEGHKMFTSLAEDAEWVFLLTRTTYGAVGRHGLTFFLVPMDSPGVSVQPVRTLSGKRTNATYYDDVFVDDRFRFGAVDGGWDVMLVALSFQRGVVGGTRDAARLVAVAEEGFGRRIGEPAVRHALARLAVDAEVAELLAGRAVSIAASGDLPGVEGAAAKLFSSEAFTRGADALLDLAGPSDLVTSAHATGWQGFLEHCFRFAPVTTIYGGTSEIQRNLVARRGLGLPRR